MLQESVVTKSIRTRYYGTLPKQAVDPDEVGGKRSAKAGYKRDWDAVVWRGYNLNGLRRYLESRVGRNWDRVMADVKACFRKESMHGLIDAVADRVLTRTYLAEDGTLMASDGFYSGVPAAQTYYKLYVDPVSRTLRRLDQERTSCRNGYRSHREQEAAELAKVRRDLPDGTQARKLNGVWFRIEFAPVPPPPADPRFSYEASPIDAVIARRVFWLSSQALHNEHARKGVYAVSKQQLSSKDIRKLGLPC